jgi:uncharacterized protein YoxC
MSQISLTQTEAQFESLEELTQELGQVYQEMLDSLDELWHNTQNLFEEKIRSLVDDCREKMNELQLVKSQTKGYFYEIGQATEMLEQIKSVIH